MHVKITHFGGIFPALDRRALPGDAAQINRNLLASVPDFRPLANDVNVATSGVSNPLTLYRLDRKADGSFNSDMTTGWVVNAARVSYGKGPLNNDTTERTYYTFDDGSAPPRWLDVTGTDRILGVPKPSAAPTVESVENGQFTMEDRVNGLEAALLSVARIIRENLAVAWVGADDPGTSTPGYINNGSPSGAPIEARQVRLYRFASVNGARNGGLSNAYSSYSLDSFQFLLGNGVPVVWALTDATYPAWAGYSPGSAPDHLGVAFDAYALTFAPNTSAIATAVGAITMPGKTDGTKLFTTAQLTNGTDGMVEQLQARLATTHPEVAPKMAALRQTVAELKSVLDAGLEGASQGQVAAFYASSEVDAAWDAALEAWATRIYWKAHTIRNASTPPTDYNQTP